MLKLTLVVLALCAVAAAFTANWNKVLTSLGSSAESSTAAKASQNSVPFTIGTCDTAGPIEIESTGGTTAPTAYPTLKDALDAINAGTHQGSISIEVCGNTTETATASINASGTGSASYTDVTVRPVGGARIIEGTITGAIIKLTGADNITIDGRQGGSGSARDLTVRNNSTAAATAAIWLTSTGVGAGATNNTIRNLEIAAGATQNTSTNSTFGIIMASNNTSISTSSGGDDNDNNSFIANHIVRARYGLVTRGQTGNNNQSPVITDNVIGPSAFGADEIGKCGIYLQADTGALVSRNTVQFVGGDFSNTTSGADRCGIGIGQEAAGATSTGSITSGDYTVIKNIIHDVVEERTFSAAGINLGTTRSGSPTNNVVANNFLYNIRSNGTGGDMVVGIGIQAGHTDTVAFNSIALTGDMDPGSASSSTNYGAGIRINGANGTNNANFTIKDNNIYLDATSNNATTHYYPIMLNNTSYAFGTGGLNNNNYYINPANTQLFTGGIASGSGAAATTEFATLTNWQAALTTPQDPNSVQGDPHFLSPTNLHIDPTVATAVEGAGTPITGVADDIDGDMRNAATPDIGADELAGIALPANDIAAIAFVDPLNGGFVPVGGSGNPKASFQNVGTATQTNVNVQFTATGPGGFNYLDTAMIASISPGQTVTVTFALSPTVTTAGVYNMSAAVTTADGNSANDILNGTFTAVASFSGTYSVGSGGDYASLTNPGGIFDAMNSVGALGNVTINITSDLTGENGTVALNEISGGFSLTIKPSGAARTITGSSTNSIIRLNGTDNVTIDGSLMGGTATGVGGDGSLRNLTIQNTNTGATAGAVVAVVQGTNSANDVTIKNVIISGQDPTQTLIGIHVGGNTIGAAPTTSSNNNVIIDNCAFKRSFIGIFNDGASAAAAATGNVITHNDITATGADRMRRAGIFFFNQNGILVQENAIGGIVGDESQDAIGIIAGIQNVSTTATTSGGVYNAIIAKNRISGVTSANTVGFSAVGIAIAGDPLGENFIGNNMISGTSAPSTSPDLVAGVFVAGVAGSNTHLYLNSIANTGDRGAVASQIGSYGIAISGSDPVVELKDNIFYNTQTSGGGANAKSYAVGMASTTFVNLSSNFNDFVSTGANAGGFRTGSLGATGTDLADLAAWQTATGDDANSLAVDPLFVNAANDLHIQMGSPMVNAGTPIAQIHDDIDSQMRDAMPDIGADELVAVNTPPTITPAVGVNRTEGSPASNGALATVTDAESGDGAVVVTVTSANPSNGVTISNIVNTNGTVTADIQASCGASNATFTLQASDGSLTNTTMLGVTVNPNSAPVLTYSNGMVSSGGSTMVSPATGPTDNGAVSNIVVQSVGTYTGIVSVDNTSGVVSFTNAGPVGMHTITIRATDNCGLTTDAAFTLDVQAPAGGPVTVTATAGTTGPTDYMTLKDAVDAINAGTHQGDITVSVVSSTTETATSVLNGSGAGAASYTSIVIRPVTDGVTIAGPSAQGRGLIELNGADNVTIDGDNPNTMGVNRNLTIQNTAANTTTFTSVVRIAVAATVTNSADNDTIKNLNLTGSATGLNLSTNTNTTGSHATTFGVFAGPGASTTDATTPPAAVTSITTSVGAGATAANLHVSNNRIVTAARGISLNGSAATVFSGTVIDKNVIGNSNAGDADQVYSTGITVGGGTNGSISGNTIWIEGYIASSASTHAIDVGVISANTTGFTVDSNMIGRVHNNNGGTWSAYGINLGGGSNHVVQNNFVSDVINSQTAGTGGFGTTFGAYGIRIASGTGHKIYHNSVHLYGALQGVTSTDTTIGLVVTSTTLTGIDVRNNIFSNQVTGGNPTGTRHFAVMLPAGATSAMNLTVNNNGYFVSSDPLARLANASTSLNAAAEYLVENFDPTQTTPSTNWRSYTSLLSAAGTNDNASFATTSAPPFTSNTDLHIPAMTATRLESGGAAVGVTIDIDAEMRNATTPDIGADEFAGQPPAANDIAATSFVVPVNGSTIPTGSMFSPQAKFVNNGTASQMMVTVRFKIFDPMMATVYDQTAMISAIAPLQAVTVTFPSTSIATPGAYAMQASAELAGDSVPGNDTINGGFNAVAPIGGTVTVGSGGTYPSLTNAGGLFEALNLAGISGDLTVDITSDLTTETGAVMLNQLVETGAGGYTVTFKPSGGARVISGTAATNRGLINLNGADRIVFDGSASGGTDRSLTITNNQTGTSTVIWIRSASASDGATNNTIKNCIINGATGTIASTTAGVLSGSGVTIGGDAEAANSNNTLQNNWIYRVQNSAYLRGGATAPNFDQNWSVTGNEFGSTASTADKNIFRGMLIGNSANFTVSGNIVHGVQSSGTTTAAMSGIQLGLLLSNGQVVNNMISDIKNISASGTGAAGISIIATSAASNVTIANNFVSNIATNGSATLTSNGHGIAFLSASTTSGYKIYFNSVNMNTDQASAQTSAALFVNSTISTAGAIDLRNNIFANNETTGSRFAVYSLAASSVFSTINYNDYFAQNVGFIGGSARVALSDWQTATGQDANSKAVDPLFVSSADLHIQNVSPMANMAAAGTGIATDIDGDMRDVTPDIGADENLSAVNPGSLQFSSATYSASENAGSVTVTVTRTGGSDGTVGVSYATSDGTATGGASCTPGVDYVTASGMLSFATGETSKTFDVTICNDATAEPDETINYTLSSPTGGAVLGSPSSAVQTITNDDVQLGTFSVGDVRIFEGNGGAHNAVFTVTYAGTGSPGSVQYATSNGTATTAGFDYVAANGTLNFMTAGTQMVSVPIVGDLNKEANETFFLNLSSPVNGIITDGQGVGIIIDDDRPYVSDFDGDLTSDVSVFRPSEGRWYVLQTTNGTPRVVDFGTAADRPVPGDYDGDGKTDLAYWRASTGQWVITYSATSTVVTTSFGTDGDKPVQGDFDGDGKTDLAVFRPSTGTWWKLQSSVGTVSAVQFGLAADLPVQGDYDGDGKTDIAVYRNGTWYISASANGQTVIANFGLSTDRPVSGDFDGDGRYDLAIFRDGDWWIYNSLTGTVTSRPWGLATDVPAPADYDHDGTTDITVFRPSNGDWYILKSSDSTLVQLHWGAGGDIPIASTYLPQ